MTDDTIYDPNSMTRVPTHRPWTDVQDSYGENIYPESDIRNSALPPTRRSLDPRKTKIVLTIAGILVSIIILVVTLPSGGSDPSVSTHAGLPLPPSDMTTKCSEELVATDGGKQACQELCEPAECCHFPTNMPLSCLPGNERRCLEYHAFCGVLTGTQASETPTDIPQAPANLPEMCTTESLATVDGFTECHDACHHAECCFEDNVTSCTTQAECQSYAPCLNLGATDHEHESIPQLVDAVCAPEVLITPEDRLKCHQVCSNALCCFADPGSAEACQHHDTSFCSQYEECNELHTGGQEIETSIFEIREACTFGDHGEIRHTSYCQLVCARGACCFSDEDCSSDVNCVDYGPCEDIFSTTGGSVDTGGGKETGGDVTKQDVQEACLASSDKTECNELCEPARCCFDDNEECSDASLDCITYFDCSIVLENGAGGNGSGSGSSPGTTNGGGVSKTDVRQACLGSDKSYCEEICKSAACCFDDQASSCDADCVKYFDCGILYQGTS